MPDIHNTILMPIAKLSVGNHRFEFNIDEAFFQNFESSEIQSGIINVAAEVEKYNNLMIINFFIEGKVKVICDRCLDLFYMPISVEDALTVRFSNIIADHDEYADNDTDIVFIDPNVEILDVSHYVYENICLGLPIQRIHPDSENGQSLCDPETIKYLQKYRIN
jgi:uncharacterized metal-binding protein YceD (DUF177 family)